MDKVYRSKVDWWVWPIISFGVIMTVFSSVALLVNSAVSRYPHPLDRHPMLAMAAFMMWIPFSTCYRITATELLVRSAFFRWRIPLVQIVEVFPTHNPLSPPLCRSTDFEINYKRPDGRPWWVMISPQDKARFLDDLAVAAGLGREPNRLVRPA